MNLVTRRTILRHSTLILFALAAPLPSLQAAPAPVDAIQPGTVWHGKELPLTILERAPNTFRGRFEVGPHITRLILGEVMGNRLWWYAKNVHPLRGNAGGDNFGVITGDRIDFTFRDKNGTGGSFTLVRVHP